MRLTFHRWTGRVAAVALALGALVVGCGGGVGEGGTGGGYSAGTISGLGSVFVNGVRYDDSAATVTGADGVASSSGRLRLGMTVEVESGKITDVGGQPTATASRVRYASELVGAVAAIDAPAGRLTVLGQTVVVGSTTAFDDQLAGGLGALAVGDVVEVYAQFDAAAGVYRATRIEPAPGADPFRLRGLVATYDANARRFTIGGADFEFAGAAPDGFAVGSFARLRIQPAAANTSRWTVLAATSGQGSAPEGREAKVRGLVNVVRSQQDFDVNGQRVNAANATLPPGSVIAVGTWVEAEGPIASGVIQASKVSIEDGPAEGGGDEYELEGLISSLDLIGKTFVVRGVTVSFAGSVSYSGGTELTLGNDVRVEVKGVLANNGTRLDATRIEFE